MDDSARLSYSADKNWSAIWSDMISYRKRWLVITSVNVNTRCKFLVVKALVLKTRSPPQLFVFPGCILIWYTFTSSLALCTYLHIPGDCAKKKKNSSWAFAWRWRRRRTVTRLIKNAALLRRYDRTCAQISGPRVPITVHKTSGTVHCVYHIGSSHRPLPARIDRRKIK